MRLNFTLLFIYLIIAVKLPAQISKDSTRTVKLESYFASLGPQITKKTSMIDTISIGCKTRLIEFFENTEETKRVHDAKNFIDVLSMAVKNGKITSLSFWEKYIFTSHKDDKSFIYMLNHFQQCYITNAKNYLAWVLLFPNNSTKIDTSTIVISKKGVQSEVGEHPCRNLNDITKAINQADKNRSILLVGHSSAYENRHKLPQWLSSKRVYAVKEYLIKQKISDYKILTRSLGNRFPITDLVYDELELNYYDHHTAKMFKINEYRRDTGFKGSKINQSVFIFVF